ncbi:acyl-CoA dehydrogenase family protein [Reyranella sp. CPCC 100927]|uniref:acyl-CoA dehydrogenase family protein n=1 Tax=Reyranella sp. CPCC 100927 TaxID=2599616 RepID=UPI0015B64942|nr:acyl-CoA dehydrogenase family protein [Reyranella sp. CPCC 100927]
MIARPCGRVKVLTERQRMIRDTARQFAQRELAPGAAGRDREGQFPADAFARMGGLGLMGMMVPEEFGGAGTDSTSYYLALMEIAAADGAASTAFQVHNSLACMPILRFGTAEQKERFLRPMATGQYLGAFCLTEPEAGSDAAAIKTRARRAGNKFVLNGVKQFITSGRSADVAVVFAVTDPTAGKKGISAFVVPTKTPGYSVARVEHTMGQRSTDHCQIVFDDCEVTPDQMLGEEGQGLSIALANLEGGRVGVAAQSVGMARAAYEAALAYAKDRRTFGKPIIEHQAVSFRLADMATALHAAELMVLRAAALRDAGQPCLKEASMAKLFASEAAEKVCSAAIQIHGGYGYLSDFPVERIYRDVRVCSIYEGTSDIQRLVIGRQLAADAGFHGVN